MGISGRLRSIAADLLPDVLGDAEVASAFINLQYIAPRLAPGARTAADRISLFGLSIRAATEQAIWKHPDGRRLWPAFVREATVPTLDLDKRWDALRFVLSCAPGGVTSPLRLAVVGRPSLAVELDFGTGYLTPTDVLEVAAALERTDWHALASGSQGRDAAQVYGWYPEARAELEPECAGLRRYYTEAALQGRAMLTWRV